MGNDSKKYNLCRGQCHEHLCKVSASFPLWLLRRRFFFFENLAFRFPWQPIKISDLDKIHMVGRGLLQKHFCKTFCKYFQNICSNTEINANFHFSHYKSMEILSCHSNESTWATTIKNIVYVEANVMNMYAKFHLHPSYGFLEEDFFENLPFMLPWQPIKFSDLDQIHMNRRGLLKKHFCKTKSKYMQRDSKNCKFPLFPL